MSRERKPRSKPGVRSEGDPRLSPEVDLLEYLYSDDQTLDQVRLPFPTLEHAQRVVTIFIKSGVAQLVSGEGNAEALVPDWQVPRIIEDPAQWSAMQSPRYRLRLTEKGHEQFVNDSERFFDELFGAS